MDLVASIRKTGSRGGVNFNWDDVATSAHRENYLGHSLKAPVGRWQKGRDLSWYAKGDAADDPNETPEEKAARERKEELKAIKEAEEDALARALGLPVAPRNTTGANAVEVSQPRIPLQDGAAAPEAEGSGQTADRQRNTTHREGPERRHKRRHRSRSRSRSRDADRRGRRHHHRDHDRDREGDRRRDKSSEDKHEARHGRARDERDDRRAHHRRRSHSREKEAHRPERPHRRHRDRSRSLEGLERRRAHGDRHRSRSRDRRRSRSPQQHRRRSSERN
ncbi:kinase phosphorylation protein-domain-containing protein [Astrocystis sublimbata]|nr:kinase phosphorylation protein-domain-containing protein [Astrocystis sublimbata]